MRLEWCFPFHLPLLRLFDKSGIVALLPRKSLMHEFYCGNAQRPHIGFLIRSCWIWLHFWRHVNPGANLILRFITVIFRLPKIANLKRSILPHSKYIPRFQIPMKNTLLVDISHRINNLRQNPPHQVLRHLFFNEFVQIAVCCLHHNYERFGRRVGIAEVFLDDEGASFQLWEEGDFLRVFLNGCLEVLAYFDPLTDVPLFCRFFYHEVCLAVCACLDFLTHIEIIGERRVGDAADHRFLTYFI